ncbi:hypothetical protein RIF29_42641 [Crotalaria pallida]|uniref:Senescence-associated protein n=2 Tax=Crotalaria pallida TaxID=3830 RepID=A0AAN9HN09_CROPI
MHQGSRTRDHAPCTGYHGSRTRPCTWIHAPGTTHHAPGTTDLAPDHAPGSMHRVPRISHQGQGTMHHAPGTRYHGSRTRPCTRIHAPGTRHDAAGPREQAAGTDHHAPGSMHQLPRISHPGSRTRCQGCGTRPCTRIYAPGITHHAPATTDLAPNHAPVIAHQGQGTMYQAQGIKHRAPGRADIEGSKSNVAMNAWLPQASYPCGNFSDTSSFKFRRTKGSIGHAFTVRIRTGNQNQTSFYPFVPHEISVLVELILGHLRYLLTDVPPQPNSPPDNVFRPDRPAEAGLGSKNRGNAPPPIHGIIGFPLSVPVLSRLFDARGRGPEGPVPNPSPDRHAATRSRRESSSSSPPTADGFGTGTPVPSPQSQSFSRGYGSILPTSLAYIVPSTRGCSPWRPDAVMSTTGRGRHSVLRIFKGRRGRTGHHATCGALPAAGPYLRLSRFQGGQAICTDGRSARAHAPGFAATVAPSYSSGPGPCPDGRVSAQLGTVTQLPVHPASPVLLTKNGPLGALDSVERLNGAATPSYLFKSDERFARQYRCGPPPEFPLASPRSGIVHHLSGPDRYALTRTLHRRSGSIGSATHRGIPPIIFLAPYGFTRPLTRTHVRLLGPCFKTGRMGSPLADARSTQVPKHAESTRTSIHNHHDDVSASMSTARAWATIAICVGPCPESIGRPALAVPHPTEAHRRPPLGRNLPPDWGCIPKQPDSPTAPRGATGSGHDGALTLSGAPFQGTWARSATEDASPDYNSDTEGDRFSWWALPGSLAVTKGILHSPSSVPSTRPKQWGNDGRHPGRRALSLMASGATCVQRLDGSRDSAIHTKYRISLRSSSMQEPRYPLPRVFRIRVSHHRPHEHRLRADGGALNDFDFLGAFGAGFLLFNREETDRTRSGASRHEGDRGAEHL